DSGESPARVHFSRMFWLFLFGMIHVWFIWYGDILVLYSVCGAIAFLAWRWRTRTLVWAGVALLAIKLVLAGFTYQSMQQIREEGQSPQASAVAKERWAKLQEEIALPSVESQLEGYRGSYADAFAARVPLTIYILTSAHPLAIS